VRLALKVDVDTLRGSQAGIPALLRLFDDFGVRATFLFSLGPDHTGRALKRVFRPGFLAKVGRTSVTSHYGIKTLLYGTLLPGPDIGKRSAAVFRQVATAGHEVGIHCYDHVKWQDHVAKRDAAWTRREMQKGADAFARIFGQPARIHGAAGWQINSHALAFEADAGMIYASDTRGTHAFLPVMDGRSFPCPQLPTTLPTLDELIGRDGITEDNVHETVRAASRQPLPDGHVYTLHAELEGMKLLPVMRRLLEYWQTDGMAVGAMQDIIDTLDPGGLPRHEVTWGEVAGRSGQLAVQGRAID
jgi:undecaprenyl phosphate-alpha-L-ara4FN deformylase